MATKTLQTDRAPTLIQGSRLSRKASPSSSCRRGLGAEGEGEGEAGERENKSAEML
jgi:hypothetical protein